VRDIIETSKRLGRTVMICHGMRYSPFYEKIKDLIDSGEIGRVMSIAASEYVSYDHMAGAFVRGKWGHTDDACPMISAKCCHDLDVIVWFMTGIRPVRVSSFGSLMHFREENAPPGSGTRCTVDCEIEKDCPYSARTLYLSRVDPKLLEQVGPDGEIDDATVAHNLEALDTYSPYGKCVWRCDNNVVDHQNVIIEFENGATANLNMIGNAARAERDIHIVGTEGELQGELRGGWLKLRKFRPDHFEHRYTEHTFDIPYGPDNHGGNDERLIEDFIACMLGEPTSKARTRVEDSLLGHQVSFAAEESRVEGRVVTLA
jgi:predicted dehydrogenase